MFVAAKEQIILYNTHWLWAMFISLTLLLIEPDVPANIVLYLLTQFQFSVNTTSRLYHFGLLLLLVKHL